MGSRREQWCRRVEQWRNSGKTAGEFAKKAGLNEKTFKHWIYMLGAGGGGRGGHSKSSTVGSRVKRSTSVRSESGVSPNCLVELQPVVVASESHFELELGKGRRLRVPAQFDPQVLKRLISVLEGSE